MAEKEEFRKKHSFLSLMGDSFFDRAMAHMGSYVSGTVSDMGLIGHPVSGCRIVLPPVADSKELLERKLKGAIRRSRHFGADILVSDPSIPLKSSVNIPGMIISRGDLYPPIAFADAIRMVSALMGIDFLRSSICVADGASDLGMAVTEVLLEKAAFLTLYTSNKERVLKNLDRYIRDSGLSPAVTGNPVKAAASCDILIYTGEANIREMTAGVRKKILIANLTGERIRLEKDFLVIDEVILKGPGEPVFHADGFDSCRLFTSRMWEGALLAASEIKPHLARKEKASALAGRAYDMGVKTSSVLGGGRLLTAQDIYAYR